MILYMMEHTEYKKTKEQENLHQLSCRIDTTKFKATEKWLGCYLLTVLQELLKSAVYSRGGRESQSTWKKL